MIRILKVTRGALAKAMHIVKESVGGAEGADASGRRSRSEKKNWVEIDGDGDSC